MDPITITAGVCSFATDSPDMAVAWVRAVVGVIMPDSFMEVVKNFTSDPKMITEMKDMVQHCLPPAA